VAAYHQMGHNSENLLFDAELQLFGGAILSPVNCVPEQARVQISRMREELHPRFDLLLDPQLYVPVSDRDNLRQWPHFPSDVDTADLSSIAWWERQNSRLIAVAGELHVNGICSPAVLPNADTFTDAYYAHLVEIGSRLKEQSSVSSGPRVLQTAVVGLRELALKDRPLQIASMLSNTKADEIYLIFYSEAPPRRELVASDQLTGAASLVAELKRARLNIIVGFCAADMIIWKAAGADSCATGKYFNLRRFARSRFEEPIDGGQQIAYFFEEGLLGFLREADVRRVRQQGLLSQATLRNPFAQRILNKLDNQPGTAWVGDGWREFMFWFADCENRISNGAEVDELTAAAEALWLDLSDRRILMDEPRNDGGWVRPWRIAACESRRPLQ
jgi:hypothetical protein